MERRRDRETESWMERRRGRREMFVFDLSACLPCCFPSRLPGKFQ